MEWRLPNRSVPVAQRTAAERFLAPAVYTTSVKAILALVVGTALLGLTGCGGGSSDPSSSSTVGSSTAAQSSDSSTAEVGRELGMAETEAEGLTQDSPKPSGPGRQGQRISQPKGP